MNDSAGAEASPQLLDEKMLLNTVKERARDFYEDLPYHNFAHADKTVQEIIKEINYCQAHGLKLDPLVLIPAAYFHDAGYNWPEALKYSSREAYAAFLARRELPRLGLPMDTVNQVSNCILSTQPDLPCQTNEDRALNRADLSNVWGEADKFVYNHLLVWQEAELLTGKPIDQTARFNASRDLLTTYANKDLCYGSFDRHSGGLSVASKAMLENIKLLLPENRDHYQYIVSQVWSPDLAIKRAL